MNLEQHGGGEQGRRRRRVLDRWQQECHGDPRLVTLACGKDRTLSIGLGADASMLNWVDETDSDAAYLTSRDDEAAEGEVEFASGNTWNDYPARVLIPVSVARQAMRRFLETRQRPDNVEWASWWDM